MGDMSAIQAKLVTNDRLQTAEDYTFLVKEGQEHTLLTFDDDTELGTLSLHLAKTIRSIAGSIRIQCDALANTQSLHDIIGRAAKAGDAILRVNINVYGPRKDSEDVGQQLSKSKIYLQRPDKQRPEMLYENPHVLDLGETYNLGADNVPFDRGDGVRPTSDAAGFRNTVSEVYASLKRGTHLRRLEGNGRLKTSLLPCVLCTLMWTDEVERTDNELSHQQEALDFLVQREVGPVPPEFSLWKPIESNGQSLSGFNLA